MAAIGFALALIIVAAVIISGNKRFLSLAGKLAIIGVIIYLIVPASTMLSDKIYQTQEDTVAQTIEEYNNLDISGDSDSGIIGEITTITTNTIDKVTNFISDLTESLAVMIVTACIVPVLVFVLLVWIMKVMFYAGGNL